MKDFLGKIGRDKVTGFTGVIVSEHRYLNGRTSLGLQAKPEDDGKPVIKIDEERYFDSVRVEVIADFTSPEELAASCAHDV